ncbi:hypothetical protein CTI14_60045, partial [Methylobacterium radiotolerans]
SAGEEHDRIGLLAVRLNIRRIVVVGPEARRLYPLRRRRGVVGQRSGTSARPGRRVRVPCSVP